MAGRIRVVRGTITELHLRTESPYRASASSAIMITGSAAEAAAAGLKPGWDTGESSGSARGAGMKLGMAV